MLLYSISVALKFCVDYPLLPNWWIHKILKFDRMSPYSISLTVVAMLMTPMLTHLFSFKVKYRSGDISDLEDRIHTPRDQPSVCKE